jgi:hypothetical protein
VVLILAALGVMVGLWRALAVLLKRPHSPDNRSVIASDSAEDWLTAAVICVAILGCVGVGLFPQVLAPWAVRFADAYTFLAP